MAYFFTSLSDWLTTIKSSILQALASGQYAGRLLPLSYLAVCRREMISNKLLGKNKAAD